MRRSLLLFLLFLILAACGSETTAGYDWTDLMGDGQLADTTDRDGEGDGGDDIWKAGPDAGGDVEGDAAEQRYEIILLHDTSTPLNTMVGETVPIRAKVIDYEHGKPAVDFPVAFRILLSTPTCTVESACARFTNKVVMTNSDGLAVSNLQVGITGETLYDISVTGEGAIGDAMQVYTKNPPVGNLRVQLKYDGSVPLKNINIRLANKYYSCGSYNPVYPWTQGVVGQKTVSSIASTPLFEGLPVAASYVLFATAQGPSGHLTASGCVDAIHVLPTDESQYTEVTFNIYLETLQPAGTYAATNRFDFTGAIPGKVGEIVGMVVDVFTNPGKIILQLVKEAVSQFVSPWLTDALFGLFQDQLASLVTNFLLNLDFLNGFFTVGGDLIQIVNNLEMKSNLNISKISSDYYLQGLQEWLGIVLYWRTGCPAEGQPGFYECAAHEFSLEDLKDTAVPIDLVTGKFTGSVASFDQLIIDTHMIDLNYGKLVLFVLNEMILPKISKYHSIKDLLFSLINCEAIGNNWIGDVLDLLHLGKDKLIEFCNTAEKWVISPIEGWISGLSAPTKIQLRGKCTMLDENDDFYVDKLTKGQWWGTIEMNGETAKEFEGTFEAAKKTK